MEKRDTYTPVASSIPFDNSTNGFLSEDTQAAIEEVRNAVDSSASPGFSFSKSGTVTKGSYLSNETVPSNLSGRLMFLISPVIANVFISQEDPLICKYEVYEHQGAGIGMTLIGSITTTASRSYSQAVMWMPTTNRQIAMRLASDSPNANKNVVTGILVYGDLS